MKYVLKDSIAYRLIRSSNSVVYTLNKALLPYEIAIEQRATLEIIKFEPDVNQTKIAKLLGKDKATISRSLSSLEKKGLITRVNDANNKRSVTSFREELRSKISEEEHEMFFNILDKLEL
jgi:DNA-binding MarR family transcriptional regulator